MKKLLSFEELRKNKVNIGSSRNKRQRNVVRVEQIGSAIMYSFGIAIFLWRENVWEGGKGCEIEIQAIKWLK